MCILSWRSAVPNCWINATHLWKKTRFWSGRERAMLYHVSIIFHHFPAVQLLTSTMPSIFRVKVMAAHATATRPLKSRCPIMAMLVRPWGLVALGDLQLVSWKGSKWHQRHIDYWWLDYRLQLYAIAWLQYSMYSLSLERDTSWQVYRLGPKVVDMIWRI